MMATGGGRPDPHRRYAMDEAGPMAPGDYYANGSDSYIQDNWGGQDPPSGDQQAPLGGIYNRFLPPGDAPTPQPGIFGNLPRTDQQTKAPNPAVANVQVPPDYPRRPGERPPSFPKVQLDNAVQDYYGVRNSPPPTLGRGKAALAGLALAGQDIPSIMNSRNIDDKSAFGYAVGDALSRVIGGLVAPKATAYNVKDFREQKALQDLGTSQQIYNQDVGGRSKEEAIDTAGARQDELYTRMDAERKRADASEKRANASEAKVIENNAVSAGVFDPVHNPIHKQMSDRHMELVGSPLSPLYGEVKSSPEDIAVNGKLWRKVVYKNAQLGHDGVQEGYVQPDGTIDPNKKDSAVDYVPERVEAAKVAANASTTNTKIRTAADYAAIAQRAQSAKLEHDDRVAKLGADQKKAVQESVDKNLKAWMDNQVINWAQLKPEVDADGHVISVEQQKQNQIDIVTESFRQQALDNLK